MVFSLTMTDRRGFALPVPSVGDGTNIRRLPFFTSRSSTWGEPVFPLVSSHPVLYISLPGVAWQSNHFYPDLSYPGLSVGENRILRCKGRNRCQSVKVMHTVFAAARWRLRSIFPVKTLPCLPCGTFAGTVISRFPAATSGKKGIKTKT